MSEDIQPTIRITLWSVAGCAAWSYTTRNTPHILRSAAGAEEPSQERT